MARLTYWMNVSPDLFIDHTGNEQGGGSWLRIGDQLHRDFNARARGFAAFVQGRVVDELILYLHPAVLGSGRPLFDRLPRPLECDLLEHAAFEGGVTLQRYAIRI